MNYLKLGKEISYALRHAPWEYELELDEGGWVSVEQLLTALKENSKWESITKEDLEYIIKNSDKKRYELVDEKIRALYGHSVPMKILKESQEPPDVLFHGTARRFMESIKNLGLQPKGRQYVHLSADIETAFQVGKRHDNKPVLLMIDAKKAWKDGIKFYLGNDKVWLADYVPSKYIHGFE
ncbi:RNA 2'-phosphotransferase [Clostridium sp. SHJSY1]|nr:RNA 2'-phosphotransferase [Clostridium sp. SHJSY1]MDS0526746.1 RNA 2'-phosphotransferase [Clostridium sp. SHJSY1]